MKRRDEDNKKRERKRRMEKLHLKYQTRVTAEP